jgi:carbon storage regulator
MLVLSRKIGEVVTIGDAITITILSNDRGIVRLGIEAPRDIPVHRKEVYDKIIEMNRQAAQTNISAFKKALVGLDITRPTADNGLQADMLILTTDKKQK